MTIQSCREHLKDTLNGRTGAGLATRAIRWSSATTDATCSALPNRVVRVDPMRSSTFPAHSRRHGSSQALFSSSDFLAARSLR